jgi:DmsE family decaheme c-type cytochrome
MKEDNVRDTCFTCHAEKRGPFLHEHASAMDDCMNCHSPHGSTNFALLKSRPPWLCQECHADSAPHPGAIYSGNNLPGGRQANANLTGGLRNPIGSGGTFVAPAPLNVINPVTGAPITSNAGSPQIMMRACVNCHAQIHGSNHPGGARFTR